MIVLNKIISGDQETRGRLRRVLRHGHYRGGRTTEKQTEVDACDVLGVRRRGAAIRTVPVDDRLVGIVEEALKSSLRQVGVDVLS